MATTTLTPLQRTAMIRENGMTAREFDSYGATVPTLRTFIGSYYELLSFVRDFMLPDPDKP